MVSSIDPNRRELPKELEEKKAKGLCRHFILTDPKISGACKPPNDETVIISSLECLKLFGVVVWTRFIQKLIFFVKMTILPLDLFLAKSQLSNLDSRKRGKLNCALIKVIFQN